MKIIIHDNNVHFMDFGGKNFVYPIDYSDDGVIVRTMQRAINSYLDSLEENKKCEECGSYSSLGCYSFCPKNKEIQDEQENS